MMKNTKGKIITASSAVAMTVGSFSGVQPVFAQETEINPVALANEAKEDTVVKTEEEKLVEAIEAAQVQEQEAKIAFEEQTGIYQQSEQKVSLAQQTYDVATQTRLAKQNEANQAILAELQKQASELDAIKAELETSTDKKETLEANLEEAQATLSEKKDAYQEAQAAYDAAVADAQEHAKPEQITEAETAVTTTEAALATAQNDLETAKQAYTDAESAYQQALAQQAEAANDVTTKQAAYDTAVQNQTLAQTAYDEAVATYEALSDPNAKAQAEANVETARLAVENAQTIVTEANIALQNAIAQTTTYEDAVIQAQDTLNAVNATIQTKESELGLLELELQQCKDNLTVAKQDYATKQQAYEDAQAQLQQTLDALNTASEELTIAQNEANNAQIEYDSALTTVESLQNQIQVNTERLDQGSYGFFNSFFGGQDKAVLDILQKGIDEGYTNLGQADDATSLDNMIKSLGIMKRCNELREEHGLDPLLTSAMMMAIGQTQANASKAMENPTHSKLYNVGENLAYGYGDNNPFTGWHDREKVVYEYLQNHSLTMEDLDADPELKSQVAQELGLPSAAWVQTGHYENIINENYYGTGAAVCDQNDWIQGQVFTSSDTTFEGAGGWMSIEAFENNLNEYIASLDNTELEKQLAEAQEKANKLEAIKAEKDRIEAEIASRISSLQMDEHYYTELANTAYTDMSLAENSMNVAQGNVDVQQDAIDQKEAEIQLIKDTDQASAQKNLYEANENLNQHLSSIEALHQEYNKKNEDLIKAQKDYEDKVTFLENFDTEVQKAQDNVNTTFNALNQAKEETSQAKTAHETAITTKSLADAQVTETKTSFDATVVSYETAQTIVAEKEESVTSAKAHLQSLKDKLTLVNTTEKTKEEAAQAIEDAKDSITSIENQIQSISIQIEQLEDNAEGTVSFKNEVQAIKDAFDAMIRSWEDSPKTYASLGTVLATLQEKVDAVALAHDKEVDAMVALNDVKANHEKVRANYLAAKADYDAAKATLDKATQDLNEYLESQKPVETPSEDEEAPTDDNFETETPDNSGSDSNGTTDDNTLAETPNNSENNVDVSAGVSEDTSETSETVTSQETSESVDTAVGFGMSSLLSMLGISSLGIVTGLKRRK